MENKAENNIEIGIENVEKDIREKMHTLKDLKHKKSMSDGKNEYCAKISNVIYEYRYCQADSLEEAEAKFEEDLEQNPHVEEEDCHGGEIEEVSDTTEN
tara:strand:- start:3929 stop:4225 length:297 start_codon:yes stop_codon:yes gene_type:complete